MLLRPRAPNSRCIFHHKRRGANSDVRSCSLPSAIRQTAVIRRIAAVAPRTAPVSFRATEDRMWFRLVVTARKRTVVRRIAAMSPRTAPRVGAAAARNLDGQRLLSGSVRHRNWCCARRDAD
jgi:hypothetical protein